MSVEMTLSKYWNLREKLFFSNYKERKKVIANFLKIPRDDVKEVITNNHRLFLVRSGDIILLVVADKKTKAPTDEFSKFVNRIASRIDPEIPIEELFVQSIIDALAEFEIRIEELNTIEKLSHI